MMADGLNLTEGQIREILCQLKEIKELGEQLLKLNVRPSKPKPEPKPKPICKNCGNDFVYAKGLCRGCYDRMRKENTNADKEKERKYHLENWKRIIAESIIPGFTPPEDFDETMDAILARLPKRDVDVLTKRNRDMKTLREIALDYDLTRERVRQLEQRALRRLRHPSNILLMQIGIAESERRKETEQQTRQAHIDAIKRSRNANLNDRTAWQLTFGIQGIEDLQLSTRAYYCLLRRGCKTLNDVAELEARGALTKVRNFGEKSYGETLEKLRETGWKRSWYSNEEELFE